MREYRCSGQTISRNQKRIGGSLLDWIDIHVELPRSGDDEPEDRRSSEPSSAVRERVERAREAQATRSAGTTLRMNVDTGQKELQTHVVLGRAGKHMMTAAVRHLHLSARG